MTFIDINDINKHKCHIKYFRKCHLKLIGIIINFNSLKGDD